MIGGCVYGFDSTGVGGWCVTHRRWCCPGLTADADHGEAAAGPQINATPGGHAIHPAFEQVKIRDAASLVLDQLAKPLADTWGCTRAGHLATIVERLGRVSTEIQNVAGHRGSPGAERAYREDLVRQLSELGANVLVMIAEELEALRR